MNDQRTVDALIAVDALVGTLHMAHAVTEDETAGAALHTALMSALTARTMLEAAVDGDPVKEPQKGTSTATMGQDDEGDEPIRLGPDPDECEHEDLLVSGDGDDPQASAMCKACGETGTWVQ